MTLAAIYPTWTPPPGLGYEQLVLGLIALVLMYAGMMLLLDVLGKKRPRNRRARS